MTTRFKEKLVDWQTMFDNLDPKLADMPQFTADHAALGAILTQGRDLEKRQDAARSELRDINQQRKEMIQNGADLRDRLARGLQGVLGPKSERLIEFGVKPLPRVVRRKRLTAAEKAARDAAAATAKNTPPIAPGPAPTSPAVEQPAEPTTR